MTVRYLKTKRGKTVLQQYKQVGTNSLGYVVFGWCNVETVDEYELPADEQSHPGDQP